MYLETCSALIFSFWLPSLTHAYIMHNLGLFVDFFFLPKEWYMMPQNNGRRKLSNKSCSLLGGIYFYFILCPNKMIL